MKSVSCVGCGRLFDMPDDYCSNHVRCEGCDPMMNDRVETIGTFGKYSDTNWHSITNTLPECYAPVLLVDTLGWWKTEVGEQQIFASGFLCPNGDKQPGWNVYGNDDLVGLDAFTNWKYMTAVVEESRDYRRMELIRDLLDSAWDNDESYYYDTQAVWKARMIAAGQNIEDINIADVA